MSESKQGISVPGAIVIAGVLIAGAVYFSKTGPAPTPAAPAEPTRPPASLEISPITSDDHIRGPENAKITILEYSDLECPFCKIFHQSMLKVLEAYPNDVRWVFRHAPIPQLHPNAPAIANAAECAAAQGKFWEFTDVVFSGSPADTGTDLADIPARAQTAGVPDLAAFQACVENNEFADKVDAQLEDGVKAGLQGTPFNMVITQDGNKAQLGGGVPFEQLQSAIDPLL